MQTVIAITQFITAMKSARISTALYGDTAASAHLVHKYVKTDQDIENDEIDDELETDNTHVQNFVNSVKSYGTSYHPNSNSFIGTELLMDFVPAMDYTESDMKTDVKTDVKTEQEEKENLKNDSEPISKPELVYTPNSSFDNLLETSKTSETSKKSKNTKTFKKPKIRKTKSRIQTPFENGSKNRKELEDEVGRILKIPGLIDIKSKSDKNSPESHVQNWFSAIQAISHFKTMLNGYKPRCEETSRYFFRFACNNPYANL